MARHVAVAERVWLSRLQGKGSAQYSLWEETDDLTAIRTMFEENAKEYHVYIDGLEESDLDEEVDTRTSEGFHSEVFLLIVPSWKLFVVQTATGLVILAGHASPR